MFISIACACSYAAEKIYLYLERLGQARLTRRTNLQNLDGGECDRVGDRWQADFAGFRFQVPAAVVEGFLQNLKITLPAECASKFVELGADLFLTADLMIEL